MLLKVIKKISGRLRRIRFRYYIYRAKLQARYYGGQLAWNPSASPGAPIIVDGAGKVSIGANVHLGDRTAPILGTGAIRLQARTAESVISIGDDTYSSNNITIVATQSVSIGTNCQIGDMVSIMDSDLHEVNPITRNNSTGISTPVRIGNNVWLGSRVMVLKGATIGDNSVIAAGSVVTKSLPENVIAAGVPAKVIRCIATTEL